MRRFAVLFVWLALFFVEPPSGHGQQQRPVARNPEFVVPAGLRARVNFWKDVFGKYGKAQVIIHHRRFPQVVFMILDFQREFAEMSPIEFEKFKERQVDRKVECMLRAQELEYSKRSNKLEDARWFERPGVIPCKERLSVFHADKSDSCDPRFFRL